MTNRIFLTLMLLIPFAANAQGNSQKPLQLTLVECIQQAQVNNYNRKSIALNEDSQKEGYNQSKMERLPNLSVSAGETYSHLNKGGNAWNGNYAVNSTVTLYQGGLINNTIEESRLSAEQTAFRTAQYDNNLTIQVLQTFLTALGNKELLHYQDAVLKASAEQLKQGKARFDAGEIVESDYLLLEAQYAGDQNSILETTVSLDNSLDALKSLMSMDLSQAIDIIYPDDSALAQMGVMPTQEQVVARSFETLPDLRVSEYNVEIAAAGVRISRSAFAPTLSLNGSVGSGHTNDFSGYGSQLSDRLNQQAGFTLSVPIFNRNRTRTNVTQSRIALKQAELELKQTEIETRQTLVQEYRNVVLAESKYRLADVRRNAYDASFETYRLMFEQGSITAVELLIQQNNYISAMNDYVQNKYGFMLKRKVLDVYMGEPVTM